MLMSTLGRVNEHRVMSEVFRLIAKAILSMSVELNAARQHITAQGGFQILVILSQWSSNSANESNLWLRIVVMLEVVVVSKRVKHVGDPHVPSGTVKRDDKVLREQVFGILRVDQGVGVRGRRVADILSPRE